MRKLLAVAVWLPSALVAADPERAPSAVRVDVPQLSVDTGVVAATSLGTALAVSGSAHSADSHIGATVSAYRNITHAARNPVTAHAGFVASVHWYHGVERGWLDAEAGFATDTYALASGDVPSHAMLAGLHVAVPTGIARCSVGFGGRVYEMIGVTSNDFVVTPTSAFELDGFMKLGLPWGTYLRGDAGIKQYTADAMPAAAAGTPDVPTVFVDGRVLFGEFAVGRDF